MLIVNVLTVVREALRWLGGKERENKLKNEKIPASLPRPGKQYVDCPHDLFFSVSSIIK